MIKKIFLRLFLLLQITSCNNSDSNTTNSCKINYEFSGNENVKDIQDNLSFIDIFPIGTGQDVTISDGCEVSVCNGDYIFTDKIQSKIYRIDQNGIFKNMIGSQGNAKNEFLDISSVQIVDDLIYVYSYKKSQILIYDLDGNLTKNIALKIRCQQYLKVEIGFFAYLGYDNGQMDARAIKVDEVGEVKESYLASNMKIITFTEMTNPLSLIDNQVYIRESYNNVINKVSDDEKSVEEVYNFNFGKHNIPKAVFKQDNAFKAAEIMLSSDFASINMFLHSDKKSLVQVTFQMTSEQKMYNVLGLTRGDNNWSWITTTEDGDNSMLFSSVKYLTKEGYLVLVVNGENASKLKKYYSNVDDSKLKEIGNNMAIVRLKIK